MKYDVAAKVIVDIGKKSILHRFLKIESDSIQLIDELPEETFSLKRTDFPLRVIRKNGKEEIVLIEIQTVFNEDFVLRLLDYSVRFTLKYHLKVTPLALLLTPSSQATGCYENDFVVFRYNIVRFWEQQAIDFLDDVNLYPFLPLMNKGENLIEEAERMIYQSPEIDIERKADLLTAMAIFAGLKDKQLSIELIKRRRDIMIQSPAYEIIKEEGKIEGKIEGKVEGKIEGKVEGKIEGLHEAISLGLELKFGLNSLVLMEKVMSVGSLEKLEIIKEAIKTAKDIKDIEKLLNTNKYN